MSDNPEVPLPKDVVAKPKKPSARGFLDSIRTSLGWEPKVAAAPAAAEASIAATPPPAGEAVGASPTPFDVLRGAPVFVPTAETPDLPPSAASLLPPVPEEEWQRARLAVDTRGSSGAVMNAAQAEVSAPAPAPIPGGEPRDLDASEVEAMYKQTAVAPLAEAPAPSPAAAELPDWLTPPLPAALDLPDWMRPPASPAAEKSPAVAPPPLAEAQSPEPTSAENIANQFGFVPGGLAAEVFGDTDYTTTAWRSIGADQLEKLAVKALHEDMDDKQIKAHFTGICRATDKFLQTKISPEQFVAMFRARIARIKGEPVSTPVQMPVAEESALASAPAPASAPEAPPPPPVEAREAEAEILESIRTFNWDMEIIRQALEALTAGEALDPESKKSALIAAATANSMLPKLPPDLLRTVLLMRAVTGKPDFNRDDFQREMLAAVNKIKQGVASKG